MLQAGQTATAASGHLVCHFSTVSRLSQRHQINGSVNDRSRTDRASVTSGLRTLGIR